MAVAENGYGISYLFPNESKIFFHISSRRSCSETDTSRFGKLLYDSLDEIRALYDDDDDHMSPVKSHSIDEKSGLKDGQKRKEKIV